ncbi:MAG: tripartite tricarboxylate transporter substrate binding protein [Planctomycetota bacterium]|jgi:tripartite-type tricarboxylate transporter receptor subunit TctC|nr:tripartite tricarboxylate transporter substrate binding protein [Planctomycetota bacterium]
MFILERVFAVLLAAILSCAAVGAGQWPRRNVEAVVTASAGGDTDFNVRTIGKYFRDVAGVPLVVTNMPGGGGSVATSNVKNARNDGSKALFCHTGQLIVNHVAGLIDYNYKDFEVSCIAGMNSSYIFVAGRQSGLASLADLVEKAKKAPGKYVYGTEFGGFTHMQGLRLSRIAGIDLKTVDVGSSSEKVTSLLAGRIDFGAVAFGAVQDYIKNGDMIVLAQGSGERNALLGDFPTMKEQGVDMVMEFPYVLSFPKGTSREIVEKMASYVGTITKNPAYAKDIEEGYKQRAFFAGPEDAVAYLDAVYADFRQYGDMLKK